jgi:integrase/recombinase XerD
MNDTRLAAFWSYMQRRGRTPATRVKYAAYLDPFVAWIGDRDLDTITAVMIELEWLGSWYTDFEQRYGRPPAPKTVANHMTALDSFFTFLVRFDFVARNPMDRIDPPKLVQRPNDALTPTEVDALLAACHSPQERAIVPFLLLTGLRSGSELPYLLNRDIDLAAGTITVRHSKTPRGRRVVPILPELRCHLERWQRYQRAIGQSAPDAPFFATRHGTPMRYRQIHDTTKRVAARAGVRTRPAPDRARTNTTAVSPHTLRRTFGSHLLNRGVRLEVVSRLLGHEATSTTEKAYASLLDDRIAAEVLLAVD